MVVDDVRVARTAFTGLTAVVALCAAGLLVSGCGSSAAPTKPTVAAAAVPPPANSVTLVALNVNAPASIAPATIAQGAATATFSDGSSRDITSQVQWSSSSDAILSVNAAGTISAHTNGDATITATFGARSQPIEIVVVPTGRFRLQVNVSGDQVTAPINDVHVQVVSGPAAGLEGTTDWNGEAILFGVTPDAQLQFTKDGYVPVTESVHLDGNWTLVRAQLLPSGGMLNLAGGYRLTIAAGPCSGDGAIPDDVRTRTYSASIWNTGARMQVALSDAAFAVAACPICHDNRGNQFTGDPGALDARFTLIDYTPPSDWNDGVYPDVVEQLPGGRLLTIAGHATVTPSAGGFAGTLDGTIAIYGALNLLNETSVPIASCQSSAHRFTLAR